MTFACYKNTYLLAHVKKKSKFDSQNKNDMALEWIVGFLLLSLPLAFAAGLVYFMAGGKGKPAATQDLIEEAKAKATSSEINQ